ncbi:NUDIX hydrolase [Candidatus Woesearchaeota archaeon]|nr:NUDIX hydrolase [Candidatus Woesearchaeota archaeon]
MPEEMIEEIDIQGTTIAVHPKSYLKQRMFRHKGSLIIPKASGDRYIISKRAADQHPFPDTWVCAAGGKVIEGESYLEAANRECKEEVGTRLELVPVTSLVYDEEDYKANFMVYTTKEPVDPKSLKGDPAEIQCFKEISLEELAEEVRERPERFAPTFRAVAEAFVRAMESQRR